jgi:hypothetical protein
MRSCATCARPYARADSSEIAAAQRRLLAFAIADSEPAWVCNTLDLSEANRHVANTEGATDERDVGETAGKVVWLALSAADTSRTKSFYSLLFGCNLTSGRGPASTI